MKIYYWWIHNFTLKRTWIGLIILLVFVYVERNPYIIDKIINKLIDDTRFLDLIIGLISGALIIHKPQKD